MRTLQPITPSEAAEAITSHYHRSAEFNDDIDGYSWWEWLIDGPEGPWAVVQIERHGEDLGYYRLR